MVSKPAYRPLLVGAGVLLLAAGGCVLPILNYESYQTLATPVAPVKGQVHAFRVDMETHGEWDRYQGAECKSWPRRETQQLTAISVDTAKGVIPSQECHAWSYGYCWCLPFFRWHDSDVCHGVAVRLYAPGYQLITLKQGQDVRELTWKTAADLPAQLAALDGLFFPGELPKTSEIDKNHTIVLAPGSKSSAHREALLFGVSEYERLTAITRLQNPPNLEWLKRLDERARQLSDLAKK